MWLCPAVTGAGSAREGRRGGIVRRHPREGGDTRWGELKPAMDARLRGHDGLGGWALSRGRGLNQIGCSICKLNVEVRHLLLGA